MHCLRFASALCLMRSAQSYCPGSKHRATFQLQKSPSSYVPSPVRACSGRYAPIPAHYGPDLRALVDALLQRDPDARPEAADILDLVYVRAHLVQYARHFRGGAAKRWSAFERAIAPFGLAGVGPAEPLLLRSVILRVQRLALQHAAPAPRMRTSCRKAGGY